MKRHSSLHPDILSAALTGLEAQKATIEGQITAVRRMLPTGRRVGGLLKTIAKPAAPIVGTSIGGPVKKRTLSAEARKRIAAAQKKRWAAVRKAAKK